MIVMSGWEEVGEAFCTIGVGWAVSFRVGEAFCTAKVGWAVTVVTGVVFGVAHPETTSTTSKILTIFE